VENVLILSADCHAGALPATYDEYMPKAYHSAARGWWAAYAREMLARTGTFFDQEAVEEYEAQSGQPAPFKAELAADPASLGDDALLRLLSDETSPFAARRGEFDIVTRTRDLDADGVAGEVLFPQMAPFGAGLIQYRNEVPAEHNREGIRAYNRWLADFCSHAPERHAGVALINVDDIDETVNEIRLAWDAGLWGGVLLPTSTGEHPFYQHPRYEPIWAVCAELGLPLHSHSGWSPDYGDVACATAMFISEVAGYAQRPLAALIWSGVFERHPDLRFVFTEAGVGWILERLRTLEMFANDPNFKHFRRGLSLGPTGYFERQCYIGASFLPPHEAGFRHEIGVEKLIWGSDYPHLEGTWPNTMKKLSETFASFEEDEMRAILGGNALSVYGFDEAQLAPIVAEIGPSVSAIRNGG
jgi:predicted TIM-barrel fold metal-dependent hydrolase